MTLLLAEGTLIHEVCSIFLEVLHVIMRLTT